MILTICLQDDYGEKLQATTLKTVEKADPQILFTQGKYELSLRKDKFPKLLKQQMDG